MLTRTLHISLKSYPPFPALPFPLFRERSFKLVSAERSSALDRFVLNKIRPDCASQTKVEQHA